MTSPVAPAEWVAGFRRPLRPETRGRPRPARDIDGDGRGDIGVGAPINTAATEQPTSAQRTSSSRCRPSSEVPWALGAFSMHGLGDYLGATLAPAGDFDGDGYDDFILFAPGEDKPASWRGVQ